MRVYGICYYVLLCTLWTFIINYCGLYGLLLWTVWTIIMDYNYGLCGLLICSCIWFEINVTYICMFEYVVLGLNIHVIFVYGLHQKIGEIMLNFFFA